MAAKIESGFGNHVGACKGFVHPAGVQAAGKAEVVAQLRVDDGCCGVQRGVHVQRGGQGFPFDLDVLQGVLRLGAGVGHHSHHRLTLPAGAVNGHGVLRRRFDARQMGERSDPGLAHLRKVGPVVHREHAGHHAGKVALYAGDAGVRHRRAPKHHVGHARQFNIVYILATPFGQAFDILPRQGLADVLCVIEQCTHAMASALCVT